tara:strand:+ start:632 stop:1567 length:936 start_codon:yes stop_codon:yes gene_type:complete
MDNTYTEPVSISDEYVTTELDISTEYDNNNGILHNDVLDLLSVTMLIYDYGKTVECVPNDSIENFASRCKIGDDCTLPLIKQQAITHLREHSSDGKIIEFINDCDSDLQVGITLSEKNKRITIVFRGSESMYDWYYDLKFLKTCINQEKNVYVHRGFYEQLTKNKNHDVITRKIKALLETYPDYHIFVTGHSLGGALSTLYGYMLSNEIKQNITVVSFASPRVGNYDWKKTFDAKSNLDHYRITNNNDIVTAFPSILYYHVGNNIRLERNNTASFLYNYSYSWWDYSIFKCYSPSDHFCEEYYKYLCEDKW